MRIACASVLVIVCLAAWIEQAAARDLGIYGSCGYSLGRGGNLWASSLAFDDDYEVKGVENHYLSIGKGLKFEGGVQEKLSKDISLRVGGGYSRLVPSLEAKNTGPSDYLWQDQTYTGRVIHLQGIVLFTADLKAVRPYAGLGGGLFFAKMKSEGPTWVCYDEDCNSYGFVDMDIDFRFSRTIGFVGVLGFDYQLQGSSRLFAELNLQQVGFPLEERELTKATEDGKDVRDKIDLDPSQPGNQTAVVYEKDSAKRPNPWILQGSSVGIRVGIIVGSW
jgi:hypothetical protein